MLRRNLRSVFVAGAYVFPGGAVDSEDREPPLVDLVAGIDESLADERIGSRGAIGFWIAAIRESFEEAGVLLARDAATDALLQMDASVSDDLAADRLALLAGDRSFADIVSTSGLVLDCGALAPVAHYITPPRAPRRYDTWFFVAAAPSGHAYSHDDDETVASTWIRPIDALEQARNEEIELIYPTFRSLQALAQFDTAAEVLAAVDAAWDAADEVQSMEDTGAGGFAAGDRRSRAPARATNDGVHGWMLGFADGGDAVDAMRHSVRTGRRVGSG